MTSKVITTILLFTSILAGEAQLTEEAAAAKAAEEAQLAEEGLKPKWVSRRPVEPDYYIGIGNVQIRDRPEKEYRNEADQLAFLEISSQIRVEVSGSSESVFREFGEFGEEMVEEFTEVTEVSTVADLEGLELVDTYRTSDEFWIYWQLSKEAHEKVITQHAETAKRLFLDDLSLSKFQVVERLRTLVQTLEALLSAHRKKVNVELAGETYFVNIEVPKRIEEIMANIESRAFNTELQGRYGKPLDVPLSFEITYESEISLPLMGVPIKYEFIEGEGNFVSSEKSTDRRGECETEVSEITSFLPLQKIRATIDLKKFKSTDAPQVLLDRYLDTVIEKRAQYYTVKISELVADNIAVKVLAESGLDNPQADYLNDRFISELKKQTDFNVIERSMMEEILSENEFNAKECSSDECVVQIGKFLAVREMIFVRLWKIGGEYRGNIKWVSIETGVIKHQLDIKHKGDLGTLADNKVPKWIKQFYKAINPGRLTLNTDISEVTVFVNREDWGELPILKKELIPGIYKVTLRSSGYETLTKEYLIKSGEIKEEEITLQLKRSFNAFKKSLVFPGLGQLYSADEYHLNRRNMGFIFMGATVASIAGTGATWAGYFQDKTDYDNAYTDYRNQNVIEDINAYRKIAEEKNSTMKKSQNTALIMTGLTVGVWIGNALEAYFGFPDYFTMFSDTGSHLGITVAASELAPGPTVGLAWRF